MVVPAETVRTSDARAASITVDVPLSQAVFDISAGMLVAGLTTSDLSLISRPLGRSFHQDHGPTCSRARTAAQEVHAISARSGNDLRTGPTVLIWTHMETGRVMEQLAPAQVDGWAQALRVPVRARRRRRCVALGAGCGLVEALARIVQAQAAEQLMTARCSRRRDRAGGRHGDPTLRLTRRRRSTGG